MVQYVQKKMAFSGFITTNTGKINRVDKIRGNDCGVKGKNLGG